jgi:threonine dehydrogenase-like Zn-dependent dehydrogenase
MPGPIEFNWNEVLSKGKAIATTNGYNDEFPIVIAMLNDGRLKAEPLITETFELDEALGFLTRFDDFGRTNVKMLIEMAS